MGIGKQGGLLVVTLQRVALWASVGEVDSSDAYWGFPLFTYNTLHSTCRTNQYVLLV